MRLSIVEHQQVTHQNYTTISDTVMYMELKKVNFAYISKQLTFYVSISL